MLHRLWGPHSVCKLWETENADSLLMGLEIGAATLEISMETTQEAKSKPTI